MAVPTVRAAVRSPRRVVLATALARPRSLPDGLRAVYRYARDFYLAGDAPRGCFLLGTAVTEANRDPEVRAVVENTMSTFAVTFAESFERAERDGELSPHAPDALAQIATAALNTFAVRAPHRRRRCGP